MCPLCLTAAALIAAGASGGGALAAKKARKAEAAPSILAAPGPRDEHVIRDRIPRVVDGGE